MISHPLPNELIENITPKPNTIPKRNNALDVLRGIAVMMVLLSHVLLMSKESVQHSVFKYIRLFFSALTIGGWSGVDLFFVLSGFLVSGLLFNEYKKGQGIHAGRFLIRRGFKIYPGFIFFILITFLIEKFEPNNLGVPLSNYLKDLFFLHNYFGGRWNHTWSLDVEEAFYFLLTAFFVVTIRSKKLTIGILKKTYLILVVIGIAGRFAADITHPRYDFDFHYHLTHYRLDALFFGVILSYLYAFKRERLFGFYTRHKVIITVLIPCLIIPNFLFHRNHDSWISVLLLATNPVAFGSLIILAINSRLKFFQNKTLAFIGRISYAVYLWHPFINRYANYYFNTSRNGFLLYIFTYAAVSILTGYIATRLIENPFLSLRERFYPSKRTAPVIAAG